MRRQQGLCPIISAKYRGHYKYPRPTELHHRCHRVGWAVKRFPLFIDSVWNLMAVNHDAHMQWPSFGKISYEEAERREKFLQRHPQIARAVNCEEEP
jgi:hypothetical protein